MDFPIYTLDTAPEASKAALAQEATFGFIPNLDIFAQAPAFSCKARWHFGTYLKPVCAC